ncbi:hypothetical protein QN375_25355 [Pseudomonas sp. MH9.2]|uniref:hypothetical protein n=1 Tax=unclassified Pseudomonas TaxID=196821 RepID=UPI002AC8F294|nr:MULTISPECIES: hypothetical protein [unclassified Pseudomonas]MEB0029055.1 hypothetical protein [Pseudomonas sp. MH9.2]MEB0150576.1 hypothetical protein [Pseudomonas sp. CCC2.2]MEE3509597.1 hypothetical protein [Pseudomonas sp. 10C3]WPX68885.1 hypothetical protein RHM55_24875 [Pseudomonas sp. MH9.2]
MIESDKEAESIALMSRDPEAAPRVVKGRGRVKAGGLPIDNNVSEVRHEVDYRS